jgi:hypothetical protein
MDNDRKHTSKVTKIFMEENCITHWESPAQSPDLNPIELVWYKLKHYCSTQKIKTKEELVNAITEFWETWLTIDQCQKYVNHALNVVPHVLLEFGKATKF